MTLETFTQQDDDGHDNFREAYAPVHRWTGKPFSEKVYCLLNYAFRKHPSLDILLWHPDKHVEIKRAEGGWLGSAGGRDVA